MDSNDVLYKFGINRERLISCANKLGLNRHFSKVPEAVKTLIPLKSGETSRESKENIFNWDKSVAIASGQGPIYLNPNIKENREQIIDELVQKLECLVDPISGARIVKKVYKKEDVYKGKYLSDAPDLLIDQAKGIHIPGTIGNTNIFNSSDRWLAENKKQGLFMAYGPGISPEKPIKDVSILDLAPTILHYFNIEPPKHMLGRILFDDSVKLKSDNKIEVTGTELNKYFLEKNRIDKILRNIRNVSN